MIVAPIPTSGIGAGEERTWQAGIRPGGVELHIAACVFWTETRVEDELDWFVANQFADRRDRSIR